MVVFCQLLALLSCSRVLARGDPRLGLGSRLSAYRRLTLGQRSLASATDQRLPVLPVGGLCGTISAYNAGQLLRLATGQPILNDPARNIVQEIGFTYQIWRTDLRQGTVGPLIARMLSMYIPCTRDFIPSVHLKSLFRFEGSSPSHTYQQVRGISLQDVVGGPGIEPAMVITARAMDGAARDGRHAMVVVGYEPRGGWLSLSDPNRPDQLTSCRLTTLDPVTRQPRRYPLMDFGSDGPCGSRLWCIDGVCNVSNRLSPP